MLKTQRHRKTGKRKLYRRGLLEIGGSFCHIWCPALTLLPGGQKSCQLSLVLRAREDSPVVILQYTWLHISVPLI